MPDEEHSVGCEVGGGFVGAELAVGDGLTGAEVGSVGAKVGAKVGGLVGAGVLGAAVTHSRGSHGACTCEHVYPLAQSELSTQAMQL